MATGGESMLGLLVVIQLPLFADGRQHFPFRTAIMLISCITHLVVSHLFFLCFSKGRLDVKYDWLKCHQFVPRARKLVAFPVDGYKKRTQLMYRLPVRCWT